MNWVFGDVYGIQSKGNCDTCGSPHNLDNLIVVYRGKYPTGHLFQVVSVFACSGCHKIVDSYNYIDDSNVTKEFQALQDH